MLLRQKMQELESVLEAGFSLTGASEKHYTDWGRNAKAAIHKWARDIQTVYLNAGKDASLKRQVHFYQAVLIRQSDRLFDRLKAETAEAVVFELIMDAIETVLETQKRLFRGFFDWTQPMSLYGLQLHHATIWSEAEVLRRHSPPNNPEFTRLVEAFCISLRQLTLSVHGRRPNYEDVSHAIYFVEVAGALLKEQDGYALFYGLMKHNFNAVEVIAWYQNTLLEELSALREPEQLSRIEAEESKCLSMGIAYPAAFNPCQTTGAEQLLVWLAKLKSRIQKSERATGANYRLPLALSVAQFGLLIRLYYLTGCFQEQNISMSLRFFTGQFISKKQDHISHKSLSKAFYAADQKTAASVRAGLQRMIDLLNKKHFPK